MTDLFGYPLFLSGVTVFFAAGLQVLTGFGFSLICVPILLYFYPGYEAIWISLVLSSFSISVQMLRNHSRPRWDLVRRLVGFGVPGLIIGLLTSGMLNAVHLKGIVGVVVLGYVLFQLIQRKKEQVPIESGERVRGFDLAGFAAGLLTGVAGIPGPPAVAVLIKMLKKEEFLATIVAYFLTIFLTAIGLSFVFHTEALTSDLFITVLILMVPTLLGLLLAHPIRQSINELNFKKLVYLLLIIVGVSSLLQSLNQ
ncbi:sulfite exporter TauE/SafE family protein [Ammoniphilus resinae]|uniref:Probable membrane transporter protein n=1 Tax=Ammoniphilus resinae TaxID=861532 RepID=A0ABS4GPL1_9BACL|nr:sulfite exporter TauE/SafE family protein [Ammoniphilus resinae]MBP1932161.1 putative membrane protein YfcA [Ammoniphilus resinae]